MHFKKPLNHRLTNHKPMIKFFRKIRFDLVDKNKTGKYLKYAIGEIILVVIGILIALQINNANNSREKRKIEQEYLVSLHTEFETNLETLNDCIVKNKEHVTDVEALLSLFDKSILDTIGKKEMSNIIHSVMAREITYVPSIGVVTDIISSGNLNLIRNKTLRQRLASFESSLTELKRQEGYTLMVKGKFSELLFKNGSIRNILLQKDIKFTNGSISESVDNKSLFSLIEFENNLLDYLLTSRYSHDVLYQNLKEEVEQVLAAIDTELIN